jgi:hypothetical protein
MAEPTTCDKITRFFMMDDLRLPILPQELWQIILYFLDVQSRKVLYLLNPLFKIISSERCNYAISLDENEPETFKLALQMKKVNFPDYNAYVIRECKIRYFEFTPAEPYDCSEVHHMCCCDCDNCDSMPPDVPAIKKYVRYKSKSTMHILFLREDEPHTQRVKTLLSSGRCEKIMSEKNLSITIEDKIIVKKHHLSKKPCELVFDKIPLSFI